MNGGVEVYQRDDGAIYVASQSRVAQGPMVVNGWCESVAADVTDDHLGTLVQEGMRVGEESGRNTALEDAEELLRPLLKLAKVKSFSALARGTRAVGIYVDDSGAYVVFPTENSGVRTGFSFRGKKKIVVPAESAPNEIGRAVRLGLAASTIVEAARAR